MRAKLDHQQTKQGDQGAELLPVSFAGQSFFAHVSGALIWPAHNCVIVADMHLEKGSALATGGQFLPPYDSQRTLAKLARLVSWAQVNQHVQRLVFLGDSFQDNAGVARLPQALRAELEDMSHTLELIWITGNHDPLFEAEASLPGRLESELMWSGVGLRHEPRSGSELDGAAEIIGHFHPKARVPGRGRDFTRPCFLIGQRRLILPAFGAYVGGLHHTSPAIRGLFETPVATYVLGRSRVQRLVSPATSSRRR